MKEKLERDLMMKRYTQQDKVDGLIQHFWKNGYLTVSRKYGTYLPNPQPIGKYDVDAVGKLKKKYALGIVLTAQELEDPQIYSKLDFLSTRHTKYSQKKVALFVGVPSDYLAKAKQIVSGLSEEARKNIRLVGVDGSKLN